MKRALLAEQLFNQGYACSQAIVKAFSDLVELEEKTLCKIALPFGGGFGRIRSLCGAVSGMGIIVGLIFSEDEQSEQNKLDVYNIIQELVKRFEEKKKTVVCKELLEKANLEVEINGKPEQRTSEYYKKRPCGNIVYTAAMVLEEFLKEKGVVL